MVSRSDKNCATLTVQAWAVLASAKMSARLFFSINKPVVLPYRLSLKLPRPTTLSGFPPCGHTVGT
jgi:hypothetical protein